MRIREIETEHFMVDIQGMFFELQPVAFEGRIWGVKPVCQHLRTIPDYCSFRGMLALGGNETTPNNDNNAVVGSRRAASGSARVTTFGVGDVRKGGEVRGAMHKCRLASRRIRFSLPASSAKRFT